MCRPCSNTELLHEIANYVGMRNLSEDNNFDECPLVVLNNNIPFFVKDEEYIKHLCGEYNCAPFFVKFPDSMYDNPEDRIPRCEISL